MSDDHHHHHHFFSSSSRSIKSAFRRKSASSASSNNSPPNHAPSGLSHFIKSSTTTTAPSTSPNQPFVSSLAARNYPHVHVKEMVYECCSRLPKHSYEESVVDCTCGKRVVDRYRELCALKGVDECPGCKYGFEEERESDYEDY